MEDMVTTLAIAKKALSFGYKRYGVPGALVSALVAVMGYRYLRKKLEMSLETGSNSESDSNE
jgi:predicted membrane protein